MEKKLYFSKVQDIVSVILFKNIIRLKSET